MNVDDTAWLCLGTALGIIMVSVVLFSYIAKGEANSWPAAFLAFTGTMGFMLACVGYYTLATNGHGLAAFTVAIVTMLACGAFLAATYRLSRHPAQ